MGEVLLLLTQTVTDFDGDIRLNFFTHHDSPGERDNAMFSPDVPRYMHKAILNKEEEEHKIEVAAKEKLLEIFEGNPSEAEHFIY